MAFLVIDSLGHDEVVVILVDGIVCEMDAQIVELFLVSIQLEWLISLSRKSDEAVPVKVYFQRVCTQH